MPRTPVAATARLSRISVRATDAEIEDLDGLRGTLNRSDFLRALIREAKTRHIALARKEAR